MLIADLHIHSKYSLATSKDCEPETLDLWARRKGIGLVGTGDFTHPAWRADTIQMRALEAPLNRLRGEARWQVFIKMYARPTADEVIAEMEQLERQESPGARVELEVNPTAML